MPENSKMQGGNLNVSTEEEREEDGQVLLAPVLLTPEVTEGGARIRVHYAASVYVPKSSNPPRRNRNNSGQQQQQQAIRDEPTVFEVSGVIDKICNKSGSSLQEGDRVIVFPSEGTTPLPQEGGFPGYILVRDVSASVVPVPGELALEVAALLPGSALLAFAAIKRSQLILQHKITAANAEKPCNILIVGASALGLWALKMAQYMFAGSDNVHITVADVCIDKLMVCKEHGCFDVVHWNDSIHEEYILERTKDVCKGGVDVAIDFVSSPRTINRLTKVLKQEGVIVVGGRSKYDITLSLNTLSDNNQCVLGVRGGSMQDLEELVDIMAAAKVSPPAFTVFPLDQANKALDQLQQVQISSTPTLLQMTPSAKQ